MTLLEQLLGLLRPAITSVVLALVALIIQELRKRTQDVRRRELLDTVEGFIATGVADAMRQVEQLKDPSRPGKWDETAAREIKLKVIREAKDAAPKIFGELIKLGVVQIDSLLFRLVEKQVSQQKPIAMLTPRVETKPAPIVTPEGREP